MIDILRREGIYLWYYFSVQLEQIIGYWALGIVIGSAISVFAKGRILSLFASLQSKRLGALGVVPACALGIASPLCMYGTIPIAASFAKLGMRHDWLAAFMMGSVLLNPQLILYSAALGPRMLAIRIVSCFVCGICAGLLVRAFYKNRPFFHFDGFEASQSRDTDPNMLMRFLKNIWRNVRATGPYFLLGVALSAVFQRYVPAGAVTRLFGDNRGFGVLMAVTIGVPLYACGGGTIPLLMDWLAMGMSQGSAAAFMITGPSTKITNLGALKIVLGAKRFALYLVFAIAFAWLCGMAIDLVLI